MSDSWYGKVCRKRAVLSDFRVIKDIAQLSKVCRAKEVLNTVDAFARKLLDHLRLDLGFVVSVADDALSTTRSIIHVVHDLHVSSFVLNTCESQLLLIVNAQRQ